MKTPSPPTRSAHPLMFAILAVQTVLLVAAWSPAPQEVVTAREIRLVDADGRERVTLSTTDAVAGITLFAASGESLGGLAATGSGLELTLADGSGNPRVILRSAAGGGGAPGLVIQDAGGRPVVELTGQSGSAGLALNAAGRVVVTSTGSGQALSLEDRAGRGRARLELGSGGAAIRFMDEVGGIVFKRP